MKWRLQFYHERRGMLAHQGVEAARPDEAVRLGWTAMLADHAPVARRRRLSLFDRAERAGGQDASGWVLYRIGTDGEPGLRDAVRANAVSPLAS